MTVNNFNNKEKGEKFDNCSVSEEFVINNIGWLKENCNSIQISENNNPNNPPTENAPTGTPIVPTRSTSANFISIPLSQFKKMLKKE